MAMEEESNGRDDVIIFSDADGKHPSCDPFDFARREFSFTLNNDVYLRFQSFSGSIELEKSIKEKCPFKIDIGPVYSVDMILDLIIFSGYTVVDVVFIVGSVTAGQEGEELHAPPAPKPLVNYPQVARRR